LNVDLFIKYTKNWDAGHAGKSSTSRIGKLLLPVLARGKEIYFVDERKGPRSATSQMCLSQAGCVVFRERAKDLYSGGL